MWPPIHGLRGITKTPVFMFLPIFVGYIAQFSVLGTICTDRHHTYMVLVASPKVAFLHVFYPFSWVIAHIFRFLGRFPMTVTTYTCFKMLHENSCFHVFSFHFDELYLTVSSSSDNLYQSWPHIYGWVASPKVAFLHVLCPIFMSYSTHFRFPRQFPTIVTTDTWI
jgi:hypothetical protein